MSKQEEQTLCAGVAKEYIRLKIKRLILEFCFDINKRFVICVGLNPIDLLPVVKLKDTVSNLDILFSKKDWCDFIKRVSLLFKSEANVILEWGSEDSMLFSLYENSKMCFKWLNRKVYMHQYTLCEILKFKHILNEKIEFLNMLNFKTYYNDVNTQVFFTKSSDNPQKFLMEKDNEMCKMAYKEMLFFYPEYIKQDLHHRNYYVPSNYEKFKKLHEEQSIK